MKQARSMTKAWPARDSAQAEAAAVPAPQSLAAMPMIAAQAQQATPFAGPRVLVQRRALSAVHESPRMVAQRQRLQAFGGAVVQRLTSVYSPDDYKNPVGWLTKNGDQGRKIVEEWGSAGIGSAIIQTLVSKLADANQRALLLEKLEGMVNKKLEAKDPSASALGAVYTGINKITDERSAWDYVRQNTLTLSKLGLASKVERQPATQGNTAAPHTYHYDAGYVVVDGASLSGGKPEKAVKASALNGPKGRGSVKGHQAIDNMKHRFVEHVHIDKEAADEKKVDIYNGSESDATAATNWPTTLGKHAQHLKPEGADQNAVGDAVAAKHEAEFLAFVQKSGLDQHQDVAEEL